MFSKNSPIYMYPLSTCVNIKMTAGIHAISQQKKKSCRKTQNPSIETEGHKDIKSPAVFIVPL